MWPPLGNLPDLGIKPMSPAAPALQLDSLLLSHWGRPLLLLTLPQKFINKKWEEMHEETDKYTYFGDIVTQLLQQLLG